MNLPKQEKLGQLNGITVFAEWYPDLEGDCLPEPVITFWWKGVVAADQFAALVDRLMVEYFQPDQEYKPFEEKNTLLGTYTICCDYSTYSFEIEGGRFLDWSARPVTTFFHALAKTKLTDPCYWSRLSPLYLPIDLAATTGLQNDAPDICRMTIHFEELRRCINLPSVINLLRQQHPHLRSKEFHQLIEQIQPLGEKYFKNTVHAVTDCE